MFFCYAIIVNPMTKLICCKKWELYKNVIYMMRKLDTATEEYIESFNKSYYHNYNCCPLKPVHCSGMFVRRLCFGADLYLTCFLIFLKHRFIFINTSSISRFVTKMECLNCPFPWFASGGGTKFFWGSRNNPDIIICQCSRHCKPGGGK